ncbi:MAG: membrane integrity-associated transporter subunit PqiC [Proteobacteria bacterium]|nr:membrane integrity-associated transporter subunit PqiC [Pseudomonadota bacterium]
MTLQRRQFLHLMGSVPVLAAGVGSLSGCSSPNPNYYRLGSVPGPTITGGPPSLEIRSVSIPGYLDRQGIVKRAGDFKLDIHSNDIWAEPLAAMLQAALVQDLTQRLTGTSVIGSGGSIGANPNLLVETNVLRFDPDPDGMMVLQAQVAVRNGQTLQIITTRSIQESGPAREPVVADIVSSMSDLWGAAANDIARLVVRTWRHMPRDAAG